MYVECVTTVCIFPIRWMVGGGAFLKGVKRPVRETDNSHSLPYCLLPSRNVIEPVKGVCQSKETIMRFVPGVCQFLSIAARCVSVKWWWWFLLCRCSGNYNIRNVTVSCAHIGSYFCLLFTLFSSQSSSSFLILPSVTFLCIRSFHFLLLFC
jgi:hypothetical protein